MLSLTAALVICIGSYLSYAGYRKIIISNHEDLIKIHQNVIIKAAYSYNNKLEKLYKSIDTKKFSEIVKQLNSNPDFANHADLDKNKLKLFARQEGVNIELVDKSSTKVIFDTQEQYSGTDLNKWERAASNIKRTEPGHLQYHYTWSDIYLYLFAYFQPVHSDFVWVIYERNGRPDTKLHQIISYFKFDQWVKENFKYLGLFDSYLTPVHGLENFPKELFRGNNFDSSTLKKSGVNFSWFPIIPADENFQEKYVRYVGLGTDSERYVESRMASIGKWLILATLSIWLLFTALLILVRNRYLLLFTRIEEQIENCIAGRQERICLDNSHPNEVHRLNKRLNEYIDIFKKAIEKNRTLASQIFNSWDNSKRRMSQDLHDTTGQLLVAANLKLAKLPEALDARELIQRASEELRTIYDNTEPPTLNALGLEKALQWYIIKFFPDNFVYTLDVDIPTSFNGYFVSQVYRVSQEIVANARKHNHEINYFKLSIRQQGNKLIILAQNDCHQQSVPLSLGNGLKNIKLRIETMAGYVDFARTDCDFVVEAHLPLAKV